MTFGLLERGTYRERLAVLGTLVGISLVALPFTGQNSPDSRFIPLQTRTKQVEREDNLPRIPLSIEEKHALENSITSESPLDIRSGGVVECTCSAHIAEELAREQKKVQAKQPTQTQLGVYVVRGGDTLSGIAQRLGIPQRELQRINGITDSNKIKIGQKLKVGGNNTKGLRSVRITGNKTLSDIAEDLGLGVGDGLQRLITLNQEKGYIGSDPNKIKDGDYLVYEGVVTEVKYGIPTIDTPSPNWKSNSRRKIDEIIVHITDGGDQSGLRDLTTRNGKKSVSAHYLVLRNADVHQLVDEKNVAWHCEGENWHTIGLEHVCREGKQLLAGQVSVSV